MGVSDECASDVRMRVECMRDGAKQENGMGEE